MRSLELTLVMQCCRERKEFLASCRRELARKLVQSLKLKVYVAESKRQQRSSFRQSGVSDR